MIIKCACKEYETELPYIEIIEPGTTKLKRYRGIRHDVNECKATTGEGNE